jgi:hypothetical protein
MIDFTLAHCYSNHKQHTRLGKGLNLEMSPHLLMGKPLAGKKKPTKHVGEKTSN